MRLFIVCVCTVLMCSCSDRILYEQLIEFENSTWEYLDLAKFDFEILDSSDEYDLYLDVHHSPTYPFENLYLRIKTEFPDATIALDTLSIEMIDNKGGWLSDCSSDACDLSVFLQQRTMFKNKGIHHISVEQFTRKAKLRGVNAIEFRIEYFPD